MNKSLLLIICFTISNNSFAQDTIAWKSIINETIYVASTAKADMGMSNAKDRVPLYINLPHGTVGYALRLTVDCTNENSKNFISALQSIPSPQTQAASIVSSLILQGDGNRCDAFIFTNREEAEKFCAKEFVQNCCKPYSQISNISNYETSCLDIVCIVFRNNNMITPLHIKVEIAALVKPKPINIISKLFQKKE